MKKASSKTENRRIESEETKETEANLKNKNKKTNKYPQRDKRGCCIQEENALKKEQRKEL